jgi:SAM-dependent methyltransferase
MHLSEFIERPARPEPWSEGDNLPWNDPDFSERMLKEHLTQDHNLASRRFPLIEQQIAWLLGVTGLVPPARILDLGCGPGLYTTRLARRGFTCHGVDFSPASIAHARTAAQQENLACTYDLADLRQADYGSGYDLAMLLYGEFNIFSPTDGQTLLNKAWQALRPRGWLALEPQSLEAVQQQGEAASSWYTARSGLFSTRPYLALEESAWHPDRQAAALRYVVIDAATAEVSLYSTGVQGYRPDQLRSLLEQTGFTEVTFYPSLVGEDHTDLAGMLAVLARRPG